MKKLFLFITLISVITISCKNEKPENKKLDPNAKLALNSAPVKSTNQLHHTARQIVDSTSTMTITGGNMGFAAECRDTVNNRLLMWGLDIIAYDSTLSTRFISSRDVVFEKWSNYNTPKWDPNKFTRDTIAYLPNATLIRAEGMIRSAYDAGDYETVYKLFQDAYTFIPITGAEWRALKAKNEQ